MEGAVYLLCAMTACACSVLLVRGWLRRRVRFLLWCALFFLALTVENVVLFLDVVVIPDTDLSLFRNAVALIGVMVLLAGLTWETK